MRDTGIEPGGQYLETRLLETLLPTPLRTANHFCGINPTILTGHTYTTRPVSALLFPTLCLPTGTLDLPDVTIVAGGDRGVMMPKRRRTRAQDLQRRVAAERRLNDEFVAERNKPPPFAAPSEPSGVPMRWQNMALRFFLIYALVELAVVVALASTIGFGWTVLLLLGTFVVGVALAGSEVRRHVRRLQSGLNASTAQGVVTDSVLVALGTVLVVIPGLASSVLGALLLLPPTRALARPVLTVMAARRVPLITVASAGASGYARRRSDYIDGEVIDVTDWGHLPLAGEDPPGPPRHPE